MISELHTSRADATLIVTIAGPDTRNALHPDMVAAAIEILSTAERDDSVRAIILSGAGQWFSSGTDLHHLTAIRAQDKAAQIDSCNSLQAWIETVGNCTKPVVAAIEGVAAGSGLALALACDLIVASNSARFMAANGRIGLTPDCGLSWLLSRSLPRQLANEMLLAGESVDAMRLHNAGLVNRVVPDGTALDTALALANDLARLAPNVITATKPLIAGAQDQTLAEHFLEEQHRFIESLQHNNAHEGIASFLKKRKADFSSK